MDLISAEGDFFQHVLITVSVHSWRVIITDNYDVSELRAPTVYGMSLSRMMSAVT